MREFTLPDLGEGLTESEIVEWRVAEGDTVSLNQVIAEVETAKALVELPSPFAGTVSKLLAGPGETVRVGQRIVSFTVEDAEPEVGPGQPAPKGPETNAEGDEVSAETPEAPAPVADEVPEASEAQEAVEAQTVPARESVLVGYGPAIETGEAPKRRHRRAGWNREREAAEEPPSEAREGVPGERRTTISGVRRRTAEAMVASAFTAPHASVFLTVDVTPTLDLIGRLREHPDFAEAKPGILALVAKAALVAIRRTPSVNAHWDDPAGEIVEFERVNLGIAAATPRGLIVPNIRDADALSLPALSAALAELTSTAREGFATVAQLSRGTFTITNVGVFGVDAGTPILTPGEAAILAVGAVRRQPWEHDGEVALRSVVTLCVSFDHRVVDGEQGSRFLADVGRILSDPGSVLAMM